MSIATKTPTILESLQASMAAAPDDEVALTAGGETDAPHEENQIPAAGTPGDEAALPAAGSQEEVPAGDKASDDAGTQADGRARDATGKFTKKELADHAAAKAAKADPVPEGLSAGLTPHWAKLPAEVKNEFKRITTESTAAVQRAQGELQVARQRTQALDPVLKPLEEAAAAQGVYVPQILHNYIAWGMAIERDPQKVIPQLIQKYGINTNAPAQDQLDPAVRQLLADQVRQAVAPFQQQAHTYEQQMQQQKVNQATNALNDFSAAKDTAGQPLRPHFQKVLPMMNTLYAATKASNPQASDAQLLQSTYDAACASDPEVRRQMADADFTARANADKAAAAERARKARAASVSPGSNAPGGNGSARNSGQSRTDTITAQVAKFYNGGGERIS